MNRRTFIGVALPVAVAGIALAQEKKPDRLSGIIRSVDASTNTIEMRGRSNPNSVRKIMYDDKTQFTLDSKPAKADALKDGQSIVAVGTFEGVNLKATKVSLKTR